MNNTFNTLSHYVKLMVMFNLSLLTNCLLIIGTLISMIDYILPLDKIKAFDEKVTCWNDIDFNMCLKSLLKKHLFILFLLIFIFTIISQNAFFKTISEYTRISEPIVIIIISVPLLVEMIIKRKILLVYYNIGLKIGDILGSALSLKFIGKNNSTIIFCIIVLGLFIFTFNEFVINLFKNLALTYFYFSLIWYFLMSSSFFLTSLLFIFEKVLHGLLIYLNKSPKGFSRTLGFIILIVGTIFSVSL